MGGNSSLAGSVEAAIDQQLQSDSVVVYSKSYCPYCKAAEALLDKVAHKEKVKVVYLDRMGSDGRAIQGALLAKTGQRTVPNIFINGRHIGGNDDLQSLHRKNGLSPLLKEAGAA
mmetsp:Transcript_35393/g.86532  ORF Transcript_35393/g.86532 Transcript_35393/m.86532 type:complete len:115 (+) Transcript_35393:100-444(+)